VLDKFLVKGQIELKEVVGRRRKTSSYCLGIKRNTTEGIYLL
jgi:hypothetical protein